MAVTAERLQVVVEAKGVGKTTKELGKLDKSVGGTTKQFGGLGKMLAGGAVVAGITAIGAVALQVGKELFNAASAAEEVNSKFNAVFKENSAAVSTWANDWAAATGQGVTELKGFLATLQDTFVPLGFARGEAADMSKQLVTLAGDLASFNNIPTADVVRDMQSALVGNVEVLRKYGVVASEAAIQQEALSSGLVENKNEITAQIKAQAILQITMKGTADAQGDLLRTQDSAANTMRRLDSAVLSLKENYGKLLTDALTPIAGALADHISMLAELRRIANEAADAEARIAAGQGDINDQLAIALKRQADINQSIERRGNTQANQERLDGVNALIARLEFMIGTTRAAATVDAAAAAQKRADDEAELQRIEALAVANAAASEERKRLAEEESTRREALAIEDTARVESMLERREELERDSEQRIFDNKVAMIELALEAEEEAFEARKSIAEQTLAILTKNVGLIGEAFATGGDAAAAFGKAAILAVADVIDALAEQAIVQAAIAFATGNIPSAVGLAAAGVAAGIAAGAVRAKANFQSGTGPDGFQVPQGFENDNFPMSASSGETVRVDRPGEDGGSNGTVILEIDGRILGQIIGDLSDAGRVRINPRSVKGL